jgi:hypothetical protein
MTLLHILRNLAVLVILTVGWLSLSPRAVAAQSTCGRTGAYCTSQNPCCSYLCCNGYHVCRSILSNACTTNKDCCNNTCVHGRCFEGI